MYNLQSNYTRGYIDFIARHTVKEQIYDVNQVTDNEGRSPDVHPARRRDV